MKRRFDRIFAWHPVLTDHQAYTYLELSKKLGVPVVVNVARYQDPTRSAQGWPDTRVTELQRNLIPKFGFMFYALKCLFQNRAQVHMFGSAFEMRRLTLLLWIALLLRADVYLISEPYSKLPLGYLRKSTQWVAKIKAAARPLAYKIYALAMRKRLKGLFAISGLSVSQFSEAGIPRSRIFPFGYFVPTVSKSPLFSARSKADHRTLRVAYVGGFLERKGLSILISGTNSAVGNGANIELDVFGPGDPSQFATEFEWVQFRGTIPFGQAQDRLRDYDLLAVPSLYDGWAVVVNEAICADVPVLCSDKVGAKTLVETFGVGYIYPAEDPVALAKTLHQISEDRGTLLHKKNSCQLAAKEIQPSVAAKYLSDVILAKTDERTNIVAPWYGIDQ